VLELNTLDPEEIATALADEAADRFLAGHPDPNLP
jgi:hypothetical protein